MFQPLQFLKTLSQKAYQACMVFFIGVTHRENFSVAGLFLPHATRAIILQIYKFARFADDVADELIIPELPNITSADRLAILNALDEILNNLNNLNNLNKNFNIVLNKNINSGLGLGLKNYIEKNLDIKFWQRFATNINLHGLDIQHLKDLLHAFKIDADTQTPKIYHTFDDLLNYCKYSANPVGRLLLKLYQNTPNIPINNPSINVVNNDDELESRPIIQLNLQKSDAICTAFQLINMYQDVCDDWHKKRLYLPLHELIKNNCLTNKATQHVQQSPHLDYEIFKYNITEFFNFKELESYLKNSILQQKNILKNNLDLVKTFASKRFMFEMIFSIVLAIKVCDNFLKNEYNVNQFKKPSIVKIHQWLLVLLKSIKIYGCFCLLPRKSRSESL